MKYLDPTLVEPWEPVEPRHEPIGTPSGHVVCFACDKPWPCDDAGVLYPLEALGLLDRITAAERERDEATRRVQAALAGHRADGTVCVTCEDWWPCETYRALTGEVA